MNRLLIGALAAAAAGSLTHAGPGDNEWLELDSEINSLATAVPQGPNGGGWTALIRSYYTYSDDDLATGGGPDISGFELDDADLAFWGEVGDYMWRVSTDFDNGSSQLEDAYTRFACGEYFDVTMGQYKSRVFLSNSVDPENQLMIDRTLLGAAFDAWILGAGASGVFDQFAYNVDVLNGFNGDESDHFYVFRGEYNYNGGTGEYEGSYGAGDSLQGTIGGVYFMDDSTPGDANLYGFDLRGTSGPISLAAEVAFLGDEVNLGVGNDFMNIFNSPATAIRLEGDATVWAVTGGYMFDEEWEAGVRYEDSDNGDDTTILTVGVNWYQSGHMGMWQANYNYINDDRDDTDIFQVGYSVGSTR